MGIQSGAVEYPAYIANTHSQLIMGQSAYNSSGDPAYANVDYTILLGGEYTLMGDTETGTDKGILKSTFDRLIADYDEDATPVNSPYEYLVPRKYTDDDPAVVDGWDIPNFLNPSTVVGNVETELAKLTALTVDGSSPWSTTYTTAVQKLTALYPTLDSLSDATDVTAMNSAISTYASFVGAASTALTSMLNTLDAYISTLSTFVDTTAEVETATSAYEATLLPALARSYNRISAGLAEINAVEGTALPTGFAIVEAEHLAQVGRYTEDMHRQVRADIRQQKATLLQGMIQLHQMRKDAVLGIQTTLIEAKQRTAALYGAMNDVLRGAATVETEWYKAQALWLNEAMKNILFTVTTGVQLHSQQFAATSDFARLAVQLNDEYAGKLAEALEMDIKWDLGILQEGSSLIGATSGIGGMQRGLTKQQQGMQTLLTVAQLGLMGASVAVGLVGALAFALGSSDEALKEDISEVDKSPLSMVEALEQKSFKYRQSNPVTHYGFIANDLELIIPEAVINVGGVRYIDRDALVSVLFGAVKELSLQVKDLKDIIKNQTTGGVIDGMES